MAQIIATLVWIIGWHVCAFKGAVFFWRFITRQPNPDPNGVDVSPNFLGLLDPRMKPEWKRLEGDPLSTHEYTNIVVERFEMDKHMLRSGVKLSAFFSVALFYGAILVMWIF